MKLKFKHQPYQEQAVQSIVKLFKGQEVDSNPFVLQNDRWTTSLFNDYGVGNKLDLTDEMIIENMQEVQKANGLERTDSLEKNHFCIEMETGTGKTYVYTKTIFELHKQYGFKKFIIVVPSVAIREGVYKSLEITKEHFDLQYNNEPFNYFIYNSSRLSDVRQFAVANTIEIMIINIDAFKKSENVINRPMEEFNGESAIRYIQDTNPVVIIDEPQSVDNTEKSKEAIASLNPLCVLRYSATHKEKLNVLYRLTPVDAYNEGLVKQISVCTNYVDFDYNKPYLKLISVSNANNKFSGKLEMDIANDKGIVKRTIKTIKVNDDLFLLSGEREVYRDYMVSGFDTAEGFESVEFSNTQKLNVGETVGSIDENIVKKSQIKTTIETHLEKELRLLDKGIKVLSLFFIDEVKKYRDYEDENLQGIYAKMFEECYTELINSKKFSKLKEKFNMPIEKIHNGYFSQDKKGQFKNTKGDTLADDDTYNTIMKDKEWLLSFECPLRFIWSHSALREGWDNPNVFQICTLVEQKNDFARRQKIGRGMRLCVNQDGERIEDKNINILTVMANESFADFSSKLQKETEVATGIKFGTIQLSLFQNLHYVENVVEVEKVVDEDIQILTKHFEKKGYIENNVVTEKFKTEVSKGTIELPKEFVGVKDTITEIVEQSENIEKFEIKQLKDTTFVTEKEVEKEITNDEAVEIIEHFKNVGYIDSVGKVKDTLKNDLKNNTLNLPQKFEKAKEVIKTTVQKADTKIPASDMRKEVIVKLKEEQFLNPKFIELWEKIKYKTTYRVSIDDEELKAIIVKDLKAMPEIVKAKIIKSKADVTYNNSGISARQTMFRTEEIEIDRPNVTNILKTLLDKCDLPKKLSCEILVESGRLKDFSNNPQLFTENIIEIVNRAKRKLEVDGIQYAKIDDSEYYLQEVFENKDFVAYLDKNAVKVPKDNNVYDYVVYDSSTIEKPFAEKLGADEDVEFFFKIPTTFKIKTPFGNYSPDWAVHLNKNGEEKIFFVIETKGSTLHDDLRGLESGKIDCGRKHFNTINEVVYDTSDSDWDKIKTKQY